MEGLTKPIDRLPQTQRRNVITVAWGLAGASLVLLIASIIGDWTGNPWVDTNLIVVVPVLAGLAGVFLARAGRTRLAVMEMSVISLVTSIYIVARLNGYGFVLGVASAVFVAGTASLGLARPWSTRLGLTGMVVGVLIVAMDLYWPFPRGESSISQYAPYILGVLSLIVLGLIARQFPSFSLRAKLISGFVFVGLAAAGAVAVYANQTISNSLIRDAGATLNDVAGLQARTTGELLIRQVDILRGGLSLNKLIQDYVVTANANYPSDPALAREQVNALDQLWRAGMRDHVVNQIIRLRLDNGITSELHEFRDSFPDHLEVVVSAP